MSRTDTEFRCPLCSAPAPETMVFGVNGELLGCEVCLTLRDGEEWFREHETLYRQSREQDWGWA